MPQTSYLLFIDKSPVHKDTKNYFAQFNIALVEQQNLLPVPPGQGTLMAILVHWSILKNQLPIIHKFYTTYPAPLLVIHDQPDEDACIRALEAGADDFIVKPINPRELHARIGAIGRRVSRTQQQIASNKASLGFGHWLLDPASRRVFNITNNQELLLSAGEYDLLLAFVQQPQHVLDRELLLHITKNRDLNPFDRRIDVQISRLRQKIEIDAKKPVLIKTVRNGGYMLTAQVTVIKE